MIELPDRTVLIGVDAGATEVKAHQVTASGDTLRIGSASASCCYDRVPGFEPVPLAEQLQELARARETGAPIVPRPVEREQGERWIDAAVGSILAVATQARRAEARIGIGLPGLKTANGRGLAVVRNGPRIPDYAARVEERLVRGGLQLAQPIGPLTSDGDNCGRGEDADRQGLFRGVENAYYVGGGTGLCEALKLGGRLVPFDEARGWLEKAWALRSSGGDSFEDVLSTRGINARYAEDAERPIPIGREEYPEERALAGDVVADGVMKEAAHLLAELVFERMVTLRHGPPPRETGEGVEHRHSPYRGTVLDRVVVGQRLGRIFGEPRYAAVFRERVERSLAHRIQRSPYARLRAAHLRHERLRPGFLRASRLRSAPALGAAAGALGAELPGASGSGTV